MPSPFRWGGFGGSRFATLSRAQEWVLRRPPFYRSSAIYCSPYNLFIKYPLSHVTLRGYFSVVAVVGPEQGVAVKEGRPQPLRRFEHRNSLIHPTSQHPTSYFEQRNGLIHSTSNILTPSSRYLEHFAVFGFFF